MLIAPGIMGLKGSIKRAGRAIPTARCGDLPIVAALAWLKTQTFWDVLDKKLEINEVPRNLCGLPRFGDELRLGAALADEIVATGTEPRPIAGQH